MLSPSMSRFCFIPAAVRRGWSGDTAQINRAVRVEPLAASGAFAIPSMTFLALATRPTRARYQSHLHLASAHYGMGTVLMSQAVYAQVSSTGCSINAPAISKPTSGRWMSPEIGQTDAALASLHRSLKRPACLPMSLEAARRAWPLLAAAERCRAALTSAD